MTILDSIVARKKAEISRLPDTRVVRKARRSFVDAVVDKRPSLIAEIKPMSPSHGKLIDRKAIPAMVDIFNRHAQAISVLCDAKDFGGGYDLLAEARSLSKLPLLAKDFILDERQIDIAADRGADAILLIAAILSAEELGRLTLHVLSLDIDILLEMHGGNEIEKIAELLEKLSPIQKRHIIFGINNRDLRTGKVDLHTTITLAPVLRERLSDSYPIVAESGITGNADIAKLAPFVRGFLVGTSILTASDPDSFIVDLFKKPKTRVNDVSEARVRLPELIGRSSKSNRRGKRTPATVYLRLPRSRGARNYGLKPKIKFCGMTRKEDIEAAERLGVDFIGFVFAKSPRDVSFDTARILRKSIVRAKLVGVFEQTEGIGEYVRELRLDYLQIYAPIGTDIRSDFGVPVIRAFRGMPDVKVLRRTLDHCAFVLIDKAPYRSVADFHDIATLPLTVRSRLFLAGGLTPENVCREVGRIKPYALDCARGIESAPGQKDKHRMSLFLHSLPV